MIKAGRDGQVKYDAAGTTPVLVVSLNKWKLDTKTEKINVTCFGASNKVYVPGMKDISGTISGFWDSDEKILFEAADADVPGLLELIPHSTEPTHKWSGKAYLDASIDTAVEGAPAVTGTFMAADSWTMAP